MHFNVIPLPQNEITVLQVLIVPISNIGEGNLSFLSAIRFFFGKKISPVSVSHLFLCNCRHIY